MDDVLLTVKREGVVTLTLNRPESRNALNAHLLSRLAEGVFDAVQDPQVRVIVLTGAGTGFCSGGDLKQGGDEPRSPTPEGAPVGKVALSTHERIAKLRAHMEAARLLHQSSKPTIAMIRGAAAGAGLSLAAACDLRIASENAVLMTAFVPHGFSGDFGGTYFWTHILGTARARELYYLSEKLDALRALEMGLLTRVVPDAALESATMSIAGELAGRLPSTFYYLKRNLNFATTATLEELLDMESTNMVLSTQAAIAALKTRGGS